MQDSSEQVWRKVPEVTLLFWVVKIAATTLGETGGDAVSMSMQLGYLEGTAIFAAIVLVAVFAQIKTKRRDLLPDEHFLDRLFLDSICPDSAAGCSCWRFPRQAIDFRWFGDEPLLGICDFFGIHYLLPTGIQTSACKARPLITSRTTDRVRQPFLANLRGVISGFVAIDLGTVVAGSRGITTECSRAERDQRGPRLPSPACRTQASRDEP